MSAYVCMSRGSALQICTTPIPIVEKNTTSADCPVLDRAGGTDGTQWRPGALENKFRHSAGSVQAPLVDESKATHKTGQKRRVRGRDGARTRRIRSEGLTR